MEILKSTVGILGLGPDKTLINEEERKSYRLEYRIQSTEYRVHNTEYRIQSTEYRVQTTDLFTFQGSLHLLRLDW